MEQLNVGDIVKLIVFNLADADPLDETNAGWLGEFNYLKDKELEVVYIYESGNFTYRSVNGGRVSTRVLSPCWVELVDDFEGNV